MDSDYGMVIYNSQTREFYNGSNLWVKPLKKARIFSDIESIRNTIDKCIKSGSVIDRAYIEVLEVAIVVTKNKRID